MKHPHLLSVLLPININYPFTYSCTEALEIGTIVKVSFRNRELYGVVWSQDEHLTNFDREKIKPIISKKIGDDCISLPTDLLSFLNWVSTYYMVPLGLALKASFKKQFFEKQGKKKIYYTLNPLHTSKITKKQETVIELLRVHGTLERNRIISISGLSNDIIKRMIRNGILTESESFVEVEEKIYLETNIDFTQEQNYAMEKISTSLKQQKVTLIDGITGSGKTELYLEAATRILRQGKQVLIMLPEITLTQEFLKIFRSRFKNQVGEWHSGLTEARRRQLWFDILNKKIRLVVGARSSLFLPFIDLGLIVVDEEHDPSYKQEEGMIYNARDMAILRAKQLKIACILSSATPSVETFENIVSKKYSRAALNKRFYGTKLPTISCIDMRKAEKETDSFLPVELIEDLKKTKERNEQSLIFLNRRGYSPLSICGNCGVRVDCPDCDAWLVLHKKTLKYKCHYCGHTQKSDIKCKNCHSSDKIIQTGLGIEKIDEELNRLLPDMSRIIFSSDYLPSPSSVSAALKQIKENKINLIIGTQLISKGHNFPSLTYVGILDADFGLEVTDIRASERTYQILNQVSGRAGRVKQESKVKIMTYMPDHPLLQSLKNNQKQEFYNAELTIRNSSRMPPFARLVAIIVSSKNRKLLNEYSQKLALINNFPKDVELLGPIEAPISRMRQYYRQRFLIRGPKNCNIQLYIKRWLDSLKLPPQIRITIDVDPQNFL